MSWGTSAAKYHFVRNLGSGSSGVVGKVGISLKFFYTTRSFLQYTNRKDGQDCAIKRIKLKKELGDKEMLNEIEASFIFYLIKIGAKVHLDLDYTNDSKSIYLNLYKFVLCVAGSWM